MNAKSTLIIIVWILILTQSCKIANEPKISDEEMWKLGWRMVESSWDENYDLAELQFDSLQAFVKPIDVKFLITGLETKMKLSKEEDVLEVMANQSQEVLLKVCERKFAKDLKFCFDRPSREN